MTAHASVDLHLYFHTPTVVLKARVNLASPVYPLTTIPFDTVTTGTYTDVQPDSFFVVGSADGLDDRGRGRVQNVLTATNIPIGRMSQGVEDGTLDIYDNDFVTVYNDYRVHAKLPYITTADPPVTYKDSNIEVGDYNTELPPVANCGPGFADYINSITSLITVAFDGSDSFAMADGATITTYAWNLQGGTVTVGTLSSATLTATFPAGFRWVSLTVTDSNGKTHTARCPILAVNPAADVTVKFQVEPHRITKEGQTIGFRILDDMLRTTIPDGALVMFWDGAPLSAADRSHMKFIGWHQSDGVSIRAQRTGLLRDTVLNCVDVAGRLATLPGFPQALERSDEVGWEFMPTLTMRKALWYLAFWHSTALSLADFILPVSLASYPAMRLDSTGSNLYDQINSRANSIVPDHWLTCDMPGVLSVRSDWMLMDVADRPAFFATIQEDYWTELRTDYHRPPRVHVLRASAVISSTDWLVIGGEETLPLAFAIAPGDAFSQGTSESIHGEQLALSQAALNACTGHRYARLNSRYGLFQITKPDQDVSDYEPAHMQRIQLDISAATAAQRGMHTTTPMGMVKEINLRYNTSEKGTVIVPTFTFELETSGLPAQTVTPLTPEQPDYETPPPPPLTIPPDFGLIGGQELVAGIGIDGYVYRTSDFQTPSGSGGPTWTRVDTTIADTIYSFVVDPFSPAYIDGAGAVNGWIVNDTAIYRVVDLFGSATATAVHTFATATVGASYHWRSIQASFGAYFAEGVNPWLLCVSYYGSTSGHTGTWATYSTDGGVTWAAEVQISALYDYATTTRFNPIGVFASPRTPGKAYTAAHIDSYSGPLPQWALYGDGGGITALSVGVSATLVSTVTDSNGGPAVTLEQYLWCCPPPNTERIVIEGEWSVVFESPGAGSCDADVTIQDAIATSLTHDFTFSEPSATLGGATGGVFQATFTKVSGADWPVHTGNFMSASLSNASRFKAYAAVSSSNPDTVTSTVTIDCRIVEIEMDDASIYYPSEAAVDGFVSSDWGATWAAMGEVMIAPGQGQGGSIHIPWEGNSDEQVAYYGHFDGSGNRLFRLKRTAGATIADVSPSAAGVTYGVNRFGFAARAYDLDRQFVVASVVGNETTADPADDKHAVYISDDAGATWVEVVAPIADSGAPAGRAAFEAAFGATSEQILFVWGPGAYITYSSNFGVSVDSRSGNLAALGLTTGLIGIAGGAA